MDRYSLESDPSARNKTLCGLEPHEPRPTIIVHRKRDVLGYKPCVLVSQRHTKSDLLQRIEKVKRLGHTYTTLIFCLSVFLPFHQHIAYTTYRSVVVAYHILCKAGPL